MSCIGPDIESWTFLSQFRVAALINDSVGTLAGGCYVDSDTKIGIILGTGTNACYVEQASNISALASKNGHGQQRPLMAINTEWGNFDASSMPYTDVRLQTSALPIIILINAIIFRFEISALASKNGHGQQRPLIAINTEWGNFDASSIAYTDVRLQTPALPIICTIASITFLYIDAAGHGQQRPLTALHT